MNSQDSYQNFYDPKTLAVMDRAFAAIWTSVKADDPFRNYAHDRELRLVIGAKLLNLVGDGIVDPIRLRQLTVESLSLPCWSKWGSRLSRCRSPNSSTRSEGFKASWAITPYWRGERSLPHRRSDRNQLLLVYWMTELATVARF
jgi:hypothetical protein